MTKVKEFRIERQSYLTTGTSTAYVVTAPDVDASIDFEITIEPHVNCAAGPVTLNVNGSGAKTIKGPDGNDLAADDLVANVPVKLFFDASQSLFFLLVRKITSGLDIIAHQNLLIPSYGNYQNTWTSAVLESGYCGGIEFGGELFLFRGIQVSSGNKYVRAFCRDGSARTAYPGTTSIGVLPGTNTASLRLLGDTVYAHNAEGGGQGFTFNMTTKTWTSYIATLPGGTTDISGPVSYSGNTLTASNKLILLGTSTERVVLPSFDIT